ncbi:PT domain-containing protein [Streptomyces sp. NPDC046712]|uniref:PT domain-containing protein n=1 Tax=Streptomyces sp. NPDC046712 TaxID=3154802 RepID=UPI0033D1020C
MPSAPILLVLVLLTALLGPLLPTGLGGFGGVAVAATAEPVEEPTAEPTADPTAEPTAEPSAEPSAEPTAEPTTEPTADPTAEPTAEPTTEPTTDPTTEPCAALALAPLGDPGDAVARATLAGDQSACFTFTVEKPGTHRVLLAGIQQSYAQVFSGETQIDCYDTDYGAGWCELTAGTYTLKVVNSGWETGEAQAAVVPLLPSTRCEDTSGTGYDAAPATGQAVSPLGIVCRNFTAAAGDRITTDFRLDKYGEAVHWITDDSGRRICPRWNEDRSEGCVLPSAAGGYRVLAEVRSAGEGFPASYSLKVRRLSSPAGCAAVTVNPYGSAPTQVSPQTECKTFTPTATGRYDVYGVSESGTRTPLTVYAADGTTVCAAWSPCTLTEGAGYTLITAESVLVLNRASAAGCTTGVPLAQVFTGTFGTAGEVDCLELPVPQGGQIAVLTSYKSGAPDPEVTIVDATGASFCDDISLFEGTCAPAGTAPYRALVSNEETTPATGDYHLVVHRTDVASSCQTFLAGDFTAAPTRMSMKTGDGVFAHCLTIPADEHSASENLQIQKVSGNASAEVSVLDATGKRVCTVRSYYGTWTTCALTPGVAHTVLFQGRDAPAEFALTRRDVMSTARGCVATAAQPVGGPSTGGTPFAPGTFLCHRVTTTDAQDTLHLNVRDPLGTARAVVYGANGDAVCDFFAAGCAITGSTHYQALVMVPEGKTAAASYRLDALRIGTAAGPAPECVKVPNVSYGFGPLTGTLTEQKTAVCAVVPAASGDRFDVKFTPAGTFDTTPTPWLYDQADRNNGCFGSISSEGHTWQCSAANAYPKVSRPATLVIGLPEKVSQAALQADVACRANLCGPEERSVGTVSPAAGVAGGKATVTLTGTALHEKDQIALSGSNGGFSVRSTTVSVAPDRRSLTATLDLTGAPVGTLNMSVYTHYGYQYSKGSFTVDAPIRSTAAPALTGTVAVGAQVTAGNGSWSVTPDSYTYQWKADGVAIAGATAATYTAPASLLGKKLSVAVTAHKAGHPAVTASSAAVALAKGVAPKATKVPSMSGAIRVGTKVTAVVGTWSPAPTSYTYQWKANGVAIAGATGASYTLPSSVLGKKLSVTVTAHRTGHLSGSATTAAYTITYGYAPTATRTPYVTGTVKVGRTLTVNLGSWTQAPTSYGYQWYANGRAISGATRATLTLTKAQRGMKITVRVNAYRPGHYAGVAWTRSTGAVAA